MSTTQEILLSLANTALPLGSALLAAGLVLRTMAADKSEQLAELAGVRNRLDSLERRVEELTSGQRDLATSNQLASALEREQAQTIDALLIAGQAFVERRRLEEVTRNPGPATGQVGHEP